MWFPFALLAAIGYSALWVLGRESRGMPASVATAVQFVAAPFVLLYAARSVDYPWGQSWWQAYLIFPFLLVPLMQWAMTHAVHRTEVTLLKPLFGISNIAALIVGVFLFGERVPPYGVLGVLLTTVGLLSLYHGRWSAWRSRGLWMGLGGAIFFGINIAVIGAVLARFPSVIGIVALAMTGSLTINSIPAIPALRRVSWSGKTVAITIGLIVAYLVQEFASLIALTLGPSSYVVAVKRTSILLTAVLGYGCLRERDQSLPRLLIASGLVVAGVAALVLSSSGV